MNTTLSESYAACEAIARQQARNFYYAFRVLPKAKRMAICAMYAFMRYCDDISDSDNPPKSKVEALERWREGLSDAMVGNYGDSRILPAFHDSIKAFGIPEVYFQKLIDGATMDLSIDRYDTFEDLYQYCYRVASVVGLVCIHIFGFHDEVAKQYAEHCGIAFQLTNILRDVKEDADRGRIYLPQEDLQAFDYHEEDVFEGTYDNRFRKLMAFQVARARDYYEKSVPLLQQVNPASRPCLAAMIGIYSSLLDRIEARDYNVYSGRVSLSSREKLRIAAMSTVRLRVNGRDAALTGPSM